MSSDADKKIELLIRYLDMQLLAQKAILDGFNKVAPGMINPYHKGVIDTLESVMSTANNIKDGFKDIEKIQND